MAGLSTLTLRNLSWGSSVERILQAALEEVDPGAAVRRWLVRQENTLIIGEKPYSLADYDRVILIGIGKAAVPMGTAVIEILGHQLTGGILLTKDGHAGNPDTLLTHPEIKVFEASHPIPDERGLRVAKHIAAVCSEARETDLIICLISGGGSALMPSPVQGISLVDLQALTTTLLACGASINEINSLRKHLDTLKGGGLARLASPASLITLILSDVVDDPLGVIASGPSVPDPTTFATAYDVLERYRITHEVPSSILKYLQDGMKGTHPETPKPGDSIFERVYNVIVGSNRLAAEAALRQAQMEGFNTILLTTSLQGEARQVGRVLSAIAKEVVASGHPIPRPACILAGGETTVTIHGDGKGGRNQELALSAVEDLAGMSDVALVTLATDGGDGPTDAAGAVATGDTFVRAHNAGMTPSEYLDRNDAYHFFAKLGDLLQPGPTQTNVNDLALMLIK